MLGASDEIIRADSRLSENACQGAHFQLSVQRNHTTPPVHMAKNHVAAALTDRMKSQSAQYANRLPSRCSGELRHEP